MLGDRQQSDAQGSNADAFFIAATKGLIAGGVNTALALGLGDPLPGAGTTLLAMLAGLAGHGVSLVLFVLALRGLGAARTGAYFSTAPFIGAAVSLILLGEPAPPAFWAAAGLMALGVWLHSPNATSTTTSTRRWSTRIRMCMTNTIGTPTRKHMTKRRRIRTGINISGCSTSTRISRIPIIAMRTDRSQMRNTSPSHDFDRHLVITTPPALAGLPPEQFDGLLNELTAMRFPAGAEVFVERQPCWGFPLVKPKVDSRSSSWPVTGASWMLYRVQPGGSCIITSSCLLDTPTTTRAASPRRI